MLWLMWAVCVLMILWTSIGFAFGNFGDAAGAREASIDRRAIVQERLVVLRKELADLPPFRPTSQAQADAATAKRKQQCETGNYCTRSRNEEAAVLQAYDLTARAAKLGADIERYEGELGSLPIIASADPQIAGGVTACPVSSV